MAIPRVIGLVIARYRRDTDEQRAMDYFPDRAISKVRNQVRVQCCQFVMLLRKISDHRFLALILCHCVLERAGHINSPGGYLRDLTSRAERGEFSLGPVLMALLRSQGSNQRQLA